MVRYSLVFYESKSCPFRGRAQISDLRGTKTLNTNQSMGIATETLKMARIAGMDASDATDAKHCVAI